MDSSTLCFAPFFRGDVTIGALANGAPGVWLGNDPWELARDEMWWQMTEPEFAGVPAKMPALESAVRRMEGVVMDVDDGFKEERACMRLMCKIDGRNEEACRRLDSKWRCTRRK